MYGYSGDTAAGTVPAGKKLFIQCKTQSVKNRACCRRCLFPQTREQFAQYNRNPKDCHFQRWSLFFATLSMIAL